MPTRDKSIQCIGACLCHISTTLLQPKLAHMTSQSHHVRPMDHIQLDGWLRVCTLVFLGAVWSFRWMYVCVAVCAVTAVYEPKNDTSRVKGGLKRGDMRCKNVYVFRMDASVDGRVVSGGLWVCQAGQGYKTREGGWL
jgi:hypothetical protein